LLAEGADNRYLIEVGAPATAPAVASAPSGIGLPGAIQAATVDAPISNMVATVIANTANFTGEYTLVLAGVAPVITYFADVPEWRAGAAILAILCYIRDLIRDLIRDSTYVM
jgi:hypothetical protein